MNFTVAAAWRFQLTLLLLASWVVCGFFLGRENLLPCVSQNNLLSFTCSRYPLVVWFSLCQQGCEVSKQVSHTSPVHLVQDFAQNQLFQTCVFHYINNNCKNPFSKSFFLWIWTYRPDNPLRVGIFWSLSTAATSLNALTRNLWHVAESFRQVAEPWPVHSDPKLSILFLNCWGKKSR